MAWEDVEVPKDEWMAAATDDENFSGAADDVSWHPLRSSSRDFWRPIDQNVGEGVAYAAQVESARCDQGEFHGDGFLDAKTCQVNLSHHVPNLSILTGSAHFSRVVFFARA